MRPITVSKDLSTCDVVVLPWTEFTYNLKEVVTRLEDTEILSYDVTTSAIGLAGQDLVPTAVNGGKDYLNEELMAHSAIQSGFYFLVFKSRSC